MDSASRRAKRALYGASIPAQGEASLFRASRTETNARAGTILSFLATRTRLLRVLRQAIPSLRHPAKQRAAPAMEPSSAVVRAR